LTGLRDIGKATEQVTVRGIQVDVAGVSAEGLVYLFNHFPAVRDMVDGNLDKFDVDTLISMAPPIIAAICAAGTGEPGNVETEAVAASLSLGEQAELLEAIFRLTFPTGVGPFVQKLKSLSDAAGAATGRGQDTTSQEPSSTVSSTGIPQPQLGDTPPDSSTTGPS
jgi:hypothetical protein